MIRAGCLRRLWQDLPVCGLEAIIGASTCLVLAPHPDDESLGCGGLIAACCAAACPPVVVILTDGSGSHPGSVKYPAPRLAAVREQEAVAAVAALGLPHERLLFLRRPDGRAPHDGPDFTAAVSQLLEVSWQYRCSAILAPWAHDPHCDHLAAARIADAVARAARLQLLSYPVWGWVLPEDAPVETGPPRGWRFDVAPYLPAKRQAIAAHASQYGGLITDDPDGFQLPAQLLEACMRPWETYLLP